MLNYDLTALIAGADPDLQISGGGGGVGGGGRSPDNEIRGCLVSKEIFSSPRASV